MTQSFREGTAPREPHHARDLQAKLYREIGISAVTAALRFTTQPDPAPRAAAKPVEAAHTAKSIAA